MLWARHAAWLAATPEGQTKSRYQVEQERFGSVAMPDLGAFDQLAKYFNEVGPLSQQVGGLIPITYHDVAGWAEATGLDIDPWTASVLVSMSKQYYYQLSSKLPMAPYQADRTEDQIAMMRQNVVAKIKKLF